MKPWRSLWVRIMAGSALVALLAVALVAILANLTTARQFQAYVGQGRQARAERLAAQAAAYYAAQGGWGGAQAWIEGAATSQGSGAPGGSRGEGRGAGGDRLLLVDDQGTVLADSVGELLGGSVPDALRRAAAPAPVMVNGRQAATLLLAREGTGYQAEERAFLDQVNRRLAWAALAAAALALLLGFLLARQITAPLRDLTRAAEGLARPSPPSQPGGPAGSPVVPVRSRDELGRLAQAFNQMSTSLSLQETLRRNLMADVAHELRTPLTVLRGELEALLDGVYEPTPAAMASLLEETLLLSRLVDDLRALALAEAGQLSLKRQPADVGTLLAGVVEAFDLQAAEQGQTLVMDVAPDLPSVDADPVRLRQIVANLVSNALRHAAREGGRVVVSARPCQACGDEAIPGSPDDRPPATDHRLVCVSVADDGPGIPPDELPHVFDRFWRGGRSRGEGSGLGLAIARELVRAHGGRIWAESSPTGTAFTFTLPAAREPAPAQHAARS